MKDIRDYNILEFTSFSNNELSSITDFQLLILKGHLIVEFSINCYLESISKSKKNNFFDDKFTFSHKVKMLDHFGSIGNENNNLFQELQLLNKIRNEIAHKLSFDSSNLLLFYNLLEEKDKGGYFKSDIIEQNNKFIAAIGFISGAIFGAYRINKNPSEIKELLKINNA